MPYPMQGLEHRQPDLLIFTVTDTFLMGDPLVAVVLVSPMLPQSRNSESNKYRLDYLSKSE